VINERFKGVEHRLGALERDAEDTGKFLIGDIQKRADSGIWYKRQWFLGAVALVALVLNGCSAVAGGVIVAKLVGH